MDEENRSKSNIFHKTQPRRMEDVLCGCENATVVTKELAEKQLSLSRSWWKTNLVMTEQRVTGKVNNINGYLCLERISSQNGFTKTVVGALSPSPNIMLNSKEHKVLLSPSESTLVQTELGCRWGSPHTRLSLLRKKVCWTNSVSF